MTKSRGINKPKARWTPELEAQLRALYPDSTAAAVAEALGLRIDQVYSRIKALGIEKSESFKSSAASGRILPGQIKPASMATRFKPGQPGWNKGMQFNAGGRSSETQFKAGQMQGEAQRKWVPVGSYRINCGGVLDRKTCDDGPTHKHWEAVHRIVWKAANGPIPKNHVITFKPGVLKPMDPPAA